MSTVLEERPRERTARAGWWPWAAVLAGLAALYVPTFADLARGAWRDDAYAHGPLILAISAALAWRARAAFQAADAVPAPRAGGALLAFGLALWLLGRTQSLVPFEAGSLIPVAAGLVLVAGGWMALARLAFPLAFLLFYVPLPGFVLDQATAPLKALVSAAAAPLLGAAGYAVERSGVVLWVDGHEMLVADACSGLNSISSLAAMGLLYAHLTRASAARMALLALAVLPIAIAANILRVMVLALATVHLGPDAAQGWIHDAAGFGVFVIGLLLLVALDKWGQVSFRTRPLLRPSVSMKDKGTGSKTNLTPFIVAVAMVGTAVAAPALKPVADPTAAAFDLERAVPAAFAGWSIDPDVAPMAIAPDVEANLARLYRQVVARTYVNAAGERMMLTVAHGGDQSDALKAHRQEACYRAQGFAIHGLGHGALIASGRSIDVTRFLARRADRTEPVTYWFTMGERVVLGRLERLRVQLENGLRGRVPDGLLVRVSSLDADAEHAYAAQAEFMAALVAAVPERHVARLAGAAHS